MKDIAMKYRRNVEKRVFMTFTLIGLYRLVVSPVFPKSADRSHPRPFDQKSAGRLLRKGQLSRKIDPLYSGNESLPLDEMINHRIPHCQRALTVLSGHRRICRIIHEIFSVRFD